MVGFLEVVAIVGLGVIIISWMIRNKYVVISGFSFIISVILGFKYFTEHSILIKILLTIGLTGFISMIITIILKYSWERFEGI